MVVQTTAHEKILVNHHACSDEANVLANLLAGLQLFIVLVDIGKENLVNRRLFIKFAKKSCVGTICVVYLAVILIWWFGNFSSIRQI